MIRSLWAEQQIDTETTDRFECVIFLDWIRLSIYTFETILWGRPLVSSSGTGMPGTVIIELSQKSFWCRANCLGNKVVNFTETFLITNLLYARRISVTSVATKWWRYQMETFSALLAICAGSSPVPGEFPTQRMFSLICVWINGWVNNREAGDLRRYRAHYDARVMKSQHNATTCEPCASSFWVL